MGSGSLWVQEEIDAAVDTWVQMLQYQQSGEKFVKAQIIRELMKGDLDQRSKSSVERRFQNISAVAMAMDVEWISGLPPLSNVGVTNWERIQQRLIHHGLGDQIESTVDDELSNIIDSLKSENEEEFQRLEAMGRVRERAWQLVTKRKGQSRFRKVLLDAYNERCVITRVNTAAALEAAHIEPYSDSMSNVPDNGILLRADIHNMFDIGLLGIDPDGFTAVLSPQLQNSSYSQHDGQKIILPNKENLMPNRKLLANHLEKAMGTW